MEVALTRTDSDAGALTAEKLCRRYAPSVCRFAAMIAGSSTDADDLAQEALLRAVRAVGSYDPAKGSPESWLWRIATCRRFSTESIFSCWGIGLGQATTTCTFPISAAVSSTESCIFHNGVRVRRP